jgi:hypothetical protein
MNPEIKKIQIVPTTGNESCYTHARAMAVANPGLLHYVEGKYRCSTHSDKPENWLGHAWCETRGGQIVDIYAVIHLSHLKFHYQKGP